MQVALERPLATDGPWPQAASRGGASKPPLGEHIISSDDSSQGP
jgi:hypothetical protein